MDVVVVSYGNRDLLHACLTSLAAQRGIRIRVRVIDNASPDGSAQMVAREFPRVEIDALENNIGFARANNMALRRTTAPVVLVLNPDTEIPPHGVRACVDRLAAEPQTGVLSPRLVDRAGRPDPRCRRGFPTIWSSICTLSGLDGHLGRRAGEYPGRWVDPERPSDVVSVSGAFMLIRREALEEVGLFDERYFMYAEDMDLCLRMRRAGWRVRYWPGVDVLHVGGGSTSAEHAPPAAHDAWFRSMAPFLRRQRPGLRGWVSALLAGALAETALTVDRHRRRGR